MGRREDCPLSQPVRVSPRSPVEALKPRRFPGFTVPIPNRRPPGRRWFRRKRSRRLYCRHLRFGLSGLAGSADAGAARAGSPHRTARPAVCAEFTGRYGRRSCRSTRPPISAHRSGWSRITSVAEKVGTSGLELLWVPGGIDILAQADLAKQTGVICLVPHLPHPGRDIDPYR